MRLLNLNDKNNRINENAQENVTWDNPERKIKKPAEKRLL